MVDCPDGGGDADLPDVELACLGGGTAGSLADIEGPAIVSFWALQLRAVPRGDAGAGGVPASSTATRSRSSGSTSSTPIPERRSTWRSAPAPPIRSYADPCGELQETRPRDHRLPTFVFVTEDGSTELVARAGSTPSTRSSSSPRTSSASSSSGARRDRPPVRRTRRPAGLAAARRRGRQRDPGHRPDRVPAPARVQPAPGRGADALRRGRRPRRPAADRARPRHALPPRPGLLPRRHHRPRRDRGRGGAAGGAGGDRGRPGRRRGVRCATRALAAAVELRGHPGARLVARPAPGRGRLARRGARDPPRGARGAVRAGPADRRPTPERLDRPRLPHRRAARRHPVGLHRRHHHPVLRLPRLAAGGRRAARPRAAALHACRVPAPRRRCPTGRARQPRHPGAGRRGGDA